MQVVLYIASIIGALALVMMLPKRRFNFTVLGGLLGAATLGGVWLALANLGPDLARVAPWWWTDAESGERTVLLYYYVFSALALVAAARVVTHPRPVYSALWFVLVVLSSAGLFLTLSAEFMAFAMVIIYAGAILVTYMFVIMLATQSANPDFKLPEGQRGAAGGAADVNETTAYDRLSREPVTATAAGFLLLAVLLTVAFDPTMRPNPAAAADPDAAILATVLTERSTAALGAEQAAHADELTSGERIGLDLFASHPLGLELAGVILTMSLIGAIVIARTRVPEEETAGAPGALPDPESGATAHATREPGPNEREAIGALGGRLGP